MSCWAGLALAFNPHGMDVPASFTPFLWMTLIGSLLLLSVYRPLLGLLRRLSMALAVKPPQQQQDQPEILTTVSTQKIQTRE